MSHFQGSCPALQGGSLGFLASLLLTSVTEVAEEAHGAVVAAFGVEEGAWLAVTIVVTSRAYTGQFR